MSAEPRRILVLAPHPDDEAIGCGGTIRGLADAGADVRVVFLTSGEAGGHGRDPAATARLREREAGRAAEALGVAGIEFWREPDGRLRARRDLADRLAERAAALGADTLYVPHAREQHPDHRAAWRLAARARTALGRAAPDVLAYEVWTALERMDEIVDISDHVAAKRRAIRAYRTQCAVLKFDDAALGLSRWRGEMHSWPGGPYAEVFARPR